MESGKQPNEYIDIENNRVLSIAVTSLRNDILGAKHISENNYTLIRIEPDFESQNEQMRRNMKQPHKPHDTNKKFKGCKYQFGLVKIPEFKDIDELSAKSILQKRCSNNQVWISGLNVAHSGNKLEKEWQRHNRNY